MRNKIEVLLLHADALEEHFGTRPGDVAEQRRRDEIIQYAISPSLYSDLSTS